MTARFGRYLIERQLAVGGMAEVYLARQSGPAGFQKKVVIKRILPHLANDERFITMFLDEARLAARLSHPNIVQIFDLGDIGGAYFIAMEYVPGHSLAKIIRIARRSERRLSTAIAARIISKVCGGLAYAHRLKDEDGRPLNLVHRDVSPDNILVTPEGALKMIDFGVAKASTNETRTQTGAIKGKFSYMSPEQIMGKRLDGRSDIFSLGIVLYELTTLHRPFGDGNDLSTVTAIVHEPHRPPLSVVSDFPPELQQIVDRSLEKDRNKRYDSAAEMQRDLERYLLAQDTIVEDAHVGQLLDDLLADGGPEPEPEPEPGDGSSDAKTLLAPGLAAEIASEAAAHVIPPVDGPPAHGPADVEVADSPIPDDPVATASPQPLLGAKQGRLWIWILLLLLLGAAGAVTAWRAGLFDAPATEGSSPDSAPRAARASPRRDPQTQAPKPATPQPSSALRRPDPRPGPAAAPEITRKPAPSRPAAPQGPDPVPAPEAPPGHGRLVVQTTPPLSVSYSGRELGVAPIQVDLPAGPARIRLRGGPVGRGGRIDEAVQMEIPEGREVRLLRVYEPAPVRFDLPEGTLVTVDGRLLGPAPIPELRVMPRTLVVELMEPGTGRRVTRKVAVPVTGTTVRHGW